MPKQEEQVAALKNATFQGIGNTPQELGDFFGDMIPNPKYGQPNEPQYIPNPTPEGEVIDEQGHVVQEEPTNYKPGDRIVDPKTGVIQEVQADGSLGPVATTDVPPNDQNNEPTPQPVSDDITSGLPVDDQPAGTSPNQPDPTGQLGDLVKELQQLNEAIPERLRRNNPLASIAEVIKSQSHAEKKISEQGETIKRQNAILGGGAGQVQSPYPTNYPQQNVPGSVPVQGIPSQGTPSGEGLELPDITEEEWEYNPREATQKFFMGTLEKLGPKFTQQIMDTIDARAMHSFRVQHPEWDDLWRGGEIAAVLRNNRELDNPASLGIVLEKAKDLRQLNMDQQRQEFLGNQDMTQVNQLAETLTKMNETVQALANEVKGIKEGTPGIVQDEVSRRVRNREADTPQPNASGGGSAQIQQQQRKNQPPPVDPNTLRFSDVERLDENVDQMVDAMINVRPKGAAERTDENALFLDMVHKGKVYNPEVDGK